MKFNSCYRIEYGFFFKERFMGKLKKVEPSILSQEKLVVEGAVVSTVYKTEHTDAEAIQSILKDIEDNEVISYSFKISNGILLEYISRGIPNKPNLILKTRLDVFKQQLFLQNIFKFFGVYLSIFIKDHKNYITGQEYVLTELRQILEDNQNPFRLSCGDYAFISSNSLSHTSDYLGIEADYERVTANDLDERKGITLVMYRDDETKQAEYDDNFVVNEETYKRFAHISEAEVVMMKSVMSSLKAAQKDFDILYNFTLDYPEYTI